MNYISEILKGILIGIANILPGVSGGTLAISMGIYDKIIHAITQFPKEPKKSILTLLPYIVGAILAVAGLSFAIDYLFIHYPLPTSLTFVGLILGGLPAIFEKIKTKKVPVSGYLAGIFMFLLVMVMTFSNSGVGKSVDLSFSLIHVIQLFFIGILAAATIIIPGISGTLILMLLGYYQPILSSINQFMIGLATRNIGMMLTECTILMPLGFGFLTGIFLCAKLIEMLFSRVEQITYCAIVGLVVSSPVAILLGVPQAQLTAVNIIIGLIFFTLALVFVLWLQYKSE